MSGLHSIMPTARDNDMVAPLTGWRPMGDDEDHWREEQHTAGSQALSPSGVALTPTLNKTVLEARMHQPPIHR